MKVHTAEGAECMTQSGNGKRAAGQSRCIPAPLTCFEIGTDCLPKSRSGSLYLMAIVGYAHFIFLFLLPGRSGYPEMYPLDRPRQFR